MRAPGKGTAGLIAGLLIGTVAVGSSQIVLAASRHHRAIHACESKSTGVLRIGRHCTRFEKAVTWNRRGPRGPRGHAGIVAGYGVAHGSAPIIDADTVSTLAKLAVPVTRSGHYLVNASAALTLANAGPTTTSDDGTCSVRAAGTGHSQTFNIDGDVQTTTVTLSVIVRVTSAEHDITLECGGAFDTGVSGSSMTAIPLAN